MFRKTISMLTCLAALSMTGLVSGEDVKIKAITLDVPKSWGTTTSQ